MNGIRPVLFVLLISLLLDFLTVPLAGFLAANDLSYCEPAAAQTLKGFCQTEEQAEEETDLLVHGLLSGAHEANGSRVSYRRCKFSPPTVDAVSLALGWIVPLRI